MPKESEFVLAKNEKEIRKAINGEKRIWQIRGCPGLKLDVRGNKTAAWRYRYNVKAEGQKWHSRSGKAEPDKFMEAVAWADDLTNNLANGQRPLSKSEVAVHAESERKRTEQGTFDSLVREWIERHGKVNKRTWHRDLANYENHLRRKIGAIQSAEITRAHITAVLNTIKDTAGGHQTIRIGSLISACFTWAVDEGYVAEHPAVRLRKRVQERKSERWLSETELFNVWSALDNIPAHIADAIRLLVMLGRRRGEVSGMRLSEIDNTRCEWNIPADRVKGKKDHRKKTIIPLSGDAIAIVRRQKASGDYVFPARLLTPQKIEDSTISARFADLARDIALDPTDAPRHMKATLHTLRHTTKTHMQAMQVPEQVSDAITGHGKQERGRGAATIYEHHAYEREMVYALRLWHLRLRDIVAGRNRVLFWSWTPAKEKRRVGRSGSVALSTVQSASQRKP